MVVNQIDDVLHFGVEVSCCRCEDGVAALGERQPSGPDGGRIGLASREVFNGRDPRGVGPPNLVELFMKYQARLDICEHAWIVVMNGE